MSSPREEADGADSLAKGSSLLLATDSGRVVGAVAVEAKGSSGSTGEQGSGPAALHCSLSAGASGCTSAGEGDLETAGSRLAVSSRRKSREAAFGPLGIITELEALAFAKELLWSSGQRPRRRGSAAAQACVAVST